MGKYGNPVDGGFVMRRVLLLCTGVAAVGAAIGLLVSSLSPTPATAQGEFRCDQEGPYTTCCTVCPGEDLHQHVFSVIIPDNTKAIVDHSDATDPTINRMFLEYAQARGFHIDPTRARHPKDKARVERSVSFVRDDCFEGERLSSIDEARKRKTAR